MYKRNLNLPNNLSLFLFGPRGTGKSSLINSTYKGSDYIDLLDSGTYLDLLARPDRITNYIQNKKDPIIIDEIQRVPALLNEIHRKIEQDDLNFILTGSSPRKLKSAEANLLAGRALKYSLFPLTAAELGSDFDIKHSLTYGMLPSLYDPKKDELDPEKYLESYVEVYLREEVMQEGLVRNLEDFSRFLEVASFSQAQQLNLSELARESAVSRKVAESYFSILIDLLLAYELPVFSKRAKRRLVSQAKFYYFDVGVYNTLRPKGILDRGVGDAGVLLESLVMQELMATNKYFDLDFDLYYWRTRSGLEVDFVLYGESGFYAIEVKSKQQIYEDDIRNLKEFSSDYPEAKAFVVYGGDKKLSFGEVEAVPVVDFLRDLPEYLSS
ncbi:MAG: ATP-binding protein [Candidatus Dojkabacteria bacterium]